MRSSTSVISESVTGCSSSISENSGAVNFIVFWWLIFVISSAWYLAFLVRILPCHIALRCKNEKPCSCNYIARYYGNIENCRRGTWYSVFSQWRQTLRLRSDRILVEKENEIIHVLLLKHKNTDKYSYVNLSKGHICKCVFDSIEDALEDIEERKKKKLLVNYQIVETFDEIYWEGDI